MPPDDDLKATTGIEPVDCTARHSLENACKPGGFAVTPRLYPRKRTRPAPPCPCGCGVLSGFCEPHRQRLAMIRESYGHEWGNKLKSVGNGKRSRPLPPRCCHPDCFEPRGLGHAFCWEHENEHAE